MSTFLTDVQGFTPVIDIVVADVGLITATVYGRVWRYCQGERRVCQASMETIGEQIGVCRRTIMTHIDKLVEAGYLEDLTPDLRNRPHTYRDTGKAKIEALLSVKEMHTSDDGVQEIHSGCAADSQHCAADAHLGVQEIHMKRERQDKRVVEETRDSTTTGEVFRAWENAVGLMSQMTKDKILDRVDEYGAENVKDAIEDANDHTNRFGISYIDKILERWSREGKQSRASPSVPTRTILEGGAVMLPGKGEQRGKR